MNKGQKMVSNEQTNILSIKTVHSTFKYDILAAMVLIEKKNVKGKRSIPKDKQPSSATPFF